MERRFLLNDGGKPAVVSSILLSSNGDDGVSAFNLAEVSVLLTVDVNNDCEVYLNHINILTTPHLYMVI